MTPKTLFIKVSKILLLSVAHLMIALYVYKLHNVLVFLGFILILINMGVLLKYFTLATQLFMAFMFHHKYRKDPMLIPIVLCGILLNAMILYLFFILLFVHLQTMISLFT